MNLPRLASTKIVFAFLLMLQPVGTLLAKTSCNDKTIIGPVVSVEIGLNAHKFIGRVDTGAKTTSINASIFKIENGHVEFVIIDRFGKVSLLKTRIIKESVVRNAESKEKRYYVHLDISHQGRQRKTLVNLNNRANSKYKILLGRNWLSCSYIVDIDKKNIY
jgi:hypothetical protein